MNLKSKFVLLAIAIFVAYQIIALYFLKVDNIFAMILVDLLLIAHFTLWLKVGKFKSSENLYFESLMLPLLMPIITYIMAVSIGSTNIWKGIIFTYSWYLFGIIPVIIGIVYVLYSIRKDGKFNYKFLDDRFDNYKKKIVKSWAYSILICIIVITSPFIVIWLDSTFTDNDAEFKQIVCDITKGAGNDTKETLALLSWFDRGEGKDENFANIYYRLKQNDVDIWLNIRDSCYIFSKPPYFCCRGDNLEWVMCARCGRCGEVGTLFNQMGYYAGLEVRKAICVGEDHVWNEVKIDGEWVVVDATAVNLPKSTGFDMPSGFMEDKVRGEWTDGRTYGNVSYVYAVYTNDLKENEDITPRYSETVNVTVKTVDKSNQSLSGVTIKVYSLNSAKTDNYDKVILDKKTNETGEYTFRLGDGEYIFKAEKGSLNGELTGMFVADDEIQIKLS